MAAEAVARTEGASSTSSEAGDALERRSEDVGDISLASGGNQLEREAEAARERRAAKGKGRMQEDRRMEEEALEEEETSMYPPESANDDERDEKRVADVRRLSETLSSDF